MTGQSGEPGSFTAGPAANDPIGDAELIQQAQELGQQHRAAGITPFGDACYVAWDEGSARLLDALGATSATGRPAADNVIQQPAGNKAYAERLACDDPAAADGPQHHRV